MPTRQPATFRAVSVIVAGILALGLAGCTAVAAPVHDPAHYSTGGTHTCVHGASIELDGDSVAFIIEGACSSVVVHGDGMTVRVQRALALSVNGQSDSVTVNDRIGSAVLKGNGISIMADSIGSVQVTGQNNSIAAPALGSVMVQGDFNAVTTHLKPSDYRAIGLDDTLVVQ